MTSLYIFSKSIGFNWNSTSQLALERNRTGISVYFCDTMMMLIVPLKIKWRLFMISCESRGSYSAFFILDTTSSRTSSTSTCVWCYCWYGIACISLYICCWTILNFSSSSLNFYSSVGYFPLWATGLFMWRLIKSAIWNLLLSSPSTVELATFVWPVAVSLSPGRYLPPSECP